MRIDALTLEGFRNYRRAALDFDPSCNVIYGENAQGKTNLLEAIVYLSCGKSPRARTDRELLGFESERAQLVGHIFSRERAFETEITLARGRRRKMTVNGVPAKNGAALSDVLHTVFFSPEDLFLIRDGAAARRSYQSFKDKRDEDYGYQSDLPAGPSSSYSAASSFGGAKSAQKSAPYGIHTVKPGKDYSKFRAGVKVRHGM